MPVNGWWLVPLGFAAAGAVALSVIAASLNRRISELRRALRPLRTGRSAASGPRNEHR
jgi:hypothetical protein